MFVRKNFLLLVVLLSVVFALAMKATVFQKDPALLPVLTATESAEFRAYWLAGQAEVNSYYRQPARFGTYETEPTLLIFEVEDFRIDTQVKAQSAASRANAIPVLKTSVVEKMPTDSLDYSLFTSVFTPVNTAILPTTLKISNSTQSWDGTTYMQVNFRNNGYQVSAHSHAEPEADENYRLDKVLFEDELYNRIRLNPAQLPTGSVQLIPGVTTSRLRHKKLEPRPATVTLRPIKAGDWFGVSGKPPFTVDSLQAYTLDYTKDARKLTIVFNRAFPHQIMGWEESYQDFGKRQTSKAMLVKSVRYNYRKQRIPADSALRHELMP